MPGHWELVIVGVVVLLLFGGRFKGVCRALGETVGLIQGVVDDDDEY